MRDKILLVGSGASLINSELGHIIDNFDGKVCRFNMYNTEGYEKDVGSKTDIWCLNAMIYYQVCFDKYEMDDDNILLYDGLESFEGDILVAGTRHLMGKYVESMEEALTFFESSKVMDSESLISSFKEIGSLKYCNVCERNHSITPTSGIQAILHYAKLGYEVYLVGFDSSNKRLKDNIDSHYYSGHKMNFGQGNSYRSVNPIYLSGPNHGVGHNMQNESKLINNLEMFNVITRLD
jgi:hypothetical protein